MRLAGRSGRPSRRPTRPGIPVFTADIACLAPGRKVVSHIATDNYGGGKQAAEAMIEALGEAGGKVAILDFKQAESCHPRVKGFKEVIDAAQRGAASGGRDRDRRRAARRRQEGPGLQGAEDALQAHPDLAGIFAINDPSALGARAALEKAGKADQVKIIGFDGQPEGKQAIKDGKIYADPIQFPDRIGTDDGRRPSGITSAARRSPAAADLIPTALYRQADGEEATPDAALTERDGDPIAMDRECHDADSSARFLSPTTACPGRCSCLCAFFSVASPSTEQHPTGAPRRRGSSPRRSARRAGRGARVLIVVRE